MSQAPVRGGRRPGAEAGRGLQAVARADEDLALAVEREHLGRAVARGDLLKRLLAAARPEGASDAGSPAARSTARERRQAVAPPANDRSRAAGHSASNPAPNAAVNAASICAALL